jgi:hypothetical protein
MARSRATEAAARAADRSTIRIDEECLELAVASPKGIARLRRLMGQVNGATYAQPYAVEESPGRFRLYVGKAAERVRTQRGIV